MKPIGAVDRALSKILVLPPSRLTPESFAAFEGPVLELKEVLDCNLVAGGIDYLLKIRVRDMADFNKLHGSKRITLPGVRQTRTFFVMKNVKDNARLPF